MTSTPESSPLPLTVVMITLNEAHNMEAVCENLRGFARDIVVLDSFSKDDTVGIALRYGARVYQRKFTNFGDQWNTAILKLPISTPWVMKLDPDERLTPELKDALREAVMANRCDGIEITRQLWFMGQPLPVRHWLIRLWRHGKCRFSDVIVNEHPIVDGLKGFAAFLCIKTAPTSTIGMRSRTTTRLVKPLRHHGSWPLPSILARSGMRWSAACG
jgi:glycosyltransferase involved in cell wall biosynthesis